MNRRAAAAAAGCLWLFAAHVRTSQQATPPVFRAGVDLVTIPVIVVDRDGAPAVGLTADDFEVLLAGRATPVRTVTFVRTSAAGAIASPAPGRDRETTNAGGDRRAVTAETQPRVLVVVIDDLSFRATSGELPALRAAVGHMLTQLGPADLAGLATTSGRAAVSPTTDRALVGAALRGVVGQFDELNLDPFVTIDEGEAITREAGPNGPVTAAVAVRECDGKKLVRMMECFEAVRAAARSVVNEASARAATQVRSILSVGRALGRVPGRKTLVVISAGLAVGERLGRDGLSAIATAVAEAGIDLYALTGEPEDLQRSERLPARARARAQEARWLHSGISDLAGAAGAPHFRVVGQPARYFDRILNETSGHYVLGVDAPAASAGRMPIAAVTVKKTGLTVRTHKHAIVNGVAPQVLTGEQQLRRALLEGVPSFDVPVTVATSSRRAANGSQIEVGVNLLVPGEIPAPLTVRFAVVDKAGRVQRSGSVSVPASGEAEHRTSFGAEVPAGEFQLRVAVMDGAGVVGTVELPVRARLTPAGRFFASDLQTFFVDDQGRQRFLALERVPARATHVGVVLELYGAGVENEGPPVIRLDVTPAGAEAAASTQMITPVVAGRFLRADTRVALAGLVPGTYSLSATVIDKGAAVGTVSTTMKKVTGEADAALGGRMAPPVITAAPPSPASPNVVAVRPSPDSVRAALQQEAGAKRTFDAAPLLAVADRHAAAIKSESAEAGAAFAQGIARLRAADARGAQSAFETASGSAPSSLSSLLYMGVAHGQAGRDREAAGAWQMGLMDEKAEDVWVSALVDGLIRLQEFSEADVVLSEGLTRFPQSRSLQRRRIERLFSTGQFAEGQPLLKALITADPNDDALRFWLISLTFADALSPDAPPSAMQQFRALAEPYMSSRGARADVVARWLAVFPKL